MNRQSGKSRPAVTGVVAALMLLTVFVGCGRRPQLVKVTGTVSFAGGKPPLGGLVMFLPEEGEQPMRPGLGSFDQDGRLFVSSFRDSDGLRPGRYRVELRCVSEIGNSHETMTVVDHVPEGFTPPELVVPASGSVIYTIDVPTKSAPR